MTTTRKEIIQQHAISSNDTGSAPVQIALLSSRVNHLTEHLKSHDKDHSARRGLRLMVGKRNRLLRYLKTTNEALYEKTIKELNLRK